MDYRARAELIAQQEGVPVDLFLRMIGQESSWQPGAVSPKGASGLAQLMPGTARELGVDPTDPIQNMTGGARYLRQQLDTFGSPELALAAYNAGPGAVQKYGGIPPFKETQDYVRKILGKNGGQAVADDAMRAIGKQPLGLLATAKATDDTESKMIPEEKPKGLLGSLGIQKMEEGAEGEAGQRFYQRDTFKDTAARMAPLLASMGSSPALQKATAGIAAQRTEAKARNKSLELLASLPGGEQFVRIAEIAGPKAGVQAYLESRKTPKDTRTDDLKEYAQAQSNGFKGTFIEYKQALASSGSSSAFGEKVSTYKNAYPEASDAEILEMIKDPEKMPAAYQSLVLRAKEAGLVPGTPKYENFMQTGGVGDATFSREQAKLRSEGLANLPINIETSKQALDVLDLALSDDYRAGLNKFVGPMDAYIPNVFGDATKFKAIHDQIKGKTFMEAYKTLKGGGQITEMEGKKATEAIARLKNSQKEKDYIEALRELRDIVQKQYMRSQSKLSEFRGGQSASGWEIVE